MLNENNADNNAHKKFGRLYEFPLNGTDYGIIMYIEQGIAMIPSRVKEEINRYTYNGGDCNWVYNNVNNIDNAWTDKRRFNIYSLGSNVFIRKSTNENCELPEPKVQPPVKSPAPFRNICEKACWPPEPENCEVINGIATCKNDAWERGYPAPPTGPKKYPDPSVVGCGWKLVRRFAEGKDNGAQHNYFHEANDFLRGTDVYGSYADDAHIDRHFSMKYDNIKFDQFLFATSNGEHWGIMSKEEVFRREYGNIVRGGYIQGGYYPDEMTEDRDYVAEHWWQHLIKSSVKNSPYKVRAHSGISSRCRDGKYNLAHHYLRPGNECGDDEIANYYNENCKKRGNGVGPGITGKNYYYTELPMWKHKDDMRGHSGVTIYMAKDDPHSPRDCSRNANPVTDPNLAHMYLEGSNVFIRDSTSEEARLCLND